MTLKQFVADRGFTMGEFRMFDKRTQEEWRKEHYDLNRQEQIERDRFPTTFLNSIDFHDEEEEILERKMRRLKEEETKL